MLFTCLCIILAAVVLYPWWRYRRACTVLSHLPCLPSLPVFGNLHQLMGDGVHILTRLTIVSKTMDYKRSPLVFWFGPIPILGVCDPLDVNAVTSACADKTANASELIWKNNPNLLQRVKNIKECQDVFSSQARKLVTQLKTEIGKESFDVNQKYVSQMVLETFCQVIFGLPSASLTKDEYQGIIRASELYMGRSINEPFFLSCLYGLAPISRDLMKDEKILKKLVETMVNKTKENGDMNKMGKYTLRKTVSELTTTIGAGYQTLANAITMCLLNIGSQTDVQDKLYNEIQELFGDDNRSITNEDLARIPYCEAVIYETLRLHPFVPLYFLHANKDIELNKCTIPKDTTCWINIWGAGRSRNVWGMDNEVFKPERWLEAQEQDQSSLMTFYFENLTGFGKEISLAMLKTTLVQCVRELVIKTNIRNLRFKMSTTLQPINGHLMRVQQRI